MKKFELALIAVISLLATIIIAVGQFLPIPFPPRPFCSNVGPGDVHSGIVAYYSAARSFSSRTCGQRLLNVCEPTGITCADLFSDPLTGVVVYKTIGGSDCSLAFLCVVKIAYDISGNERHLYAQSTVDHWPLLVTNCQNGRACMSTVPASFMKTMATLSLPQPYTFTTILQNSSNSFVLFFMFADSADGSAEMYYWPGTDACAIGVGAAPAPCPRNKFMSAQGQINGASSNFLTDGYINTAFPTTVGTDPINGNISILGNGTDFGSGYWAEGGICSDVCDLSANQLDFYDIRVYIPAPATVFLSPSGDDTHDGSTPMTAWKTVNKFNRSAFAPGTVISFEGGQIFTGCPSLWWNGAVPSGGDAHNPIIIGSYGTGKARINSNCPGTPTGPGGIFGPKSALLTIDGVSGVTVQDLILSANGTETQWGALIENSQNGTTARNVTLQRLDISDFHTSVPQDYSAEIFIIGFSLPGPCGNLDNVNILYNELHGAHGPTSTDDSGINGYSCGAGNVTNVTYRGNLVHDIGGHSGYTVGGVGNGILVNGITGFTVEQNFVHDVGANSHSCGGPAGAWAFSSTDGVFRANEVARVQPIPNMPNMPGCDWNGGGADGGVQRVIFEHNYIHDNYGAGLYTCGNCGGSGWGPNVYRENILRNNGRQHDPIANTGVGTAAELSFGSKTTASYVIDVYNNTIENTYGSPLVVFNEGTFASGIFANNIFHASGPANISGTTMVWRQNAGAHADWVTQPQNNIWYTPTGGTPVWTSQGPGPSFTLTNYASLAAMQAALGFETGSISSNPFLIAPIGGDCASAAGPAPCPTGYDLAGGSPGRGFGLDLTMAPYSRTVSSADYYGNAISAPYNAGAVQFTACPAGPGDAEAGANAYYSVARAYTSATCGAPLFHACEPTKITCVDLVSNSMTGNLVYQTIGGTDCAIPSPSGCVIQKNYDLTGNGKDIASVGAPWPILTSECTPNRRACAKLQTGSEMRGASNVAVTQPFTLTGVSNTSNTSLTFPVISLLGGAATYYSAGAGCGMSLGVTTTSGVHCYPGYFNTFQAQFNGASSLLDLSGNSTTEASLSGAGATGLPSIMAGGAGEWSEGGVYPRLIDLGDNQRRYYNSTDVVFAAAYVSPSGSDANPGTIAAPWQTITKVNSVTFVPGSSVLFQGGQSFTGCPNFAWNTNIPSGGDSTNVTTAGSYGVGTATLVSNCPGVDVGGGGGPKSALVTIDGVSGFKLTNVKLDGNNNLTQYGIVIGNSHGGSTVASNITVQGVETTGGFATDQPFDAGAHLFLAGFFDKFGVCGALDTIYILNNVMHGATPTSIDMQGVGGHSCGNGPAPHTNVTNVLIQGNEIYNMGGQPTVNSGSGIVVNGVDGGLVQHNLAHDISGNGNTCGGGVGIWAYQSNAIIFQFNEAYHVRNVATGSTAGGCDRSGMGFDALVTNSILQFNYSHENDGAGFYTCCGGFPWGPNVARYNIFTGNALQLSGFGTGSQVYMKNAGYLDFYNNTIYGDNIGPMIFIDAYTSGGVLANNIFHAAGSGTYLALFWNHGSIPYGMTFVGNNIYYTPTGRGFYVPDLPCCASLADLQTQTGLEVGSTTVNPSISMPGAGGICGASVLTTGPQPCPSEYNLLMGSPAIGAGLNLNMLYGLSVGARDYYGNTIPHITGTGYNIGADGAPH